MRRFHLRGFNSNQLCKLNAVYEINCKYKKLSQRCFSHILHDCKLSAAMVLDSRHLPELIIYS